MDFDEEVRAAQARKAQRVAAAQAAAATAATSEAAQAARREPAVVLADQIHLRAKLPGFSALCDGANRFFAAPHPVAHRHVHLTTDAVSVQRVESETRFSDGKVRRASTEDSPSFFASLFRTGGWQGSVVWVPLFESTVTYRHGGNRHGGSRLDELVRQSSALALVAPTGPANYFEPVKVPAQAFWFRPDGVICFERSDAPVTALLAEGRFTEHDLAIRCEGAVRTLAASLLEPASWAHPEQFGKRTRTFQPARFLDQFKPW